MNESTQLLEATIIRSLISAQLILNKDFIQFNVLKQYINSDNDTDIIITDEELKSALQRLYQDKQVIIFNPDNNKSKVFYSCCLKYVNNNGKVTDGWKLSKHSVMSNK